MSTVAELANLLQITPEKLQAVTSLDVRSIRVDEFPEAISQLTGLKQLFVDLHSSHHKRINEIPSWISALSKLERLCVEKGAITHIPFELGLLSELKELTISNNKVRSVDANIGNLSNLSSLDLSNNQLESLPASVSRLQSIKYIDLSTNAFSLYKKKRVTLDENDTEDAIPSQVADDALNEGFVLLTKKMKPINMLPPEMLNLPTCEVTLLGNLNIPVRFINRYQSLLRKSSDPVKRALQLFHVMNRLPRVDPRIIDAYEKFSSVSLRLDLDNPQDVQKIAEYIKMATKADALLFLENPLVQDFVKRRWDNGVRFNEYFASKVRTGATQEGFVSSFVSHVKQLPTYANDLIPPFLPSIRAKFLMYGVLYIIFLVLLMQYLTLKNTSYEEPKYFLTSKLRDTFTPDHLLVEDVWDYLKGDFLDAVFEGPDDYSLLVADNQESAVESLYRVSGFITLRQLRSQIVPCVDVMPARYLSLSTQSRCVRPWLGYESKEPYGPNGTFTFAPSKGKGRIYPSYGELEIGYDDDGFVQILSPDKEESLQLLEELEENRWIDLQTRVISISFVITNDNLDSSALIAIVLEFPVSGGVLSSIQVDVFPRRWLRFGNDLQGRLQVVLAVYVASFIIFEIQKMRFLGKKYFADLSNILDIIFVLNLVAVGSLDLWIYIENSNFENIEDPESVQDFMFTMYISEFQNRLTSVLVLLAWLRMLILQSIHPSLGPMQLIIVAMTKDIAEFLLLLVIFLMGFSFAFFTIYSGYTKSNYTVIASITTLVRALFGDFDFEEIEEQDPIIGPALFYIFMITCTIMLLNFLIAILSGTYEDVKQLSERQYRKLFAETVLAFDSAPFPPPSNLVRPFYLILESWWVNRMPPYPMIWRFRDMDRNMELLSPIPHYEKVFKKDVKRMVPAPCLLLDKIVWWIISTLIAVIILLMAPIYFFVAKKNLQKRMDSVTKWIGVFTCHILWLATLPLWGIIWDIWKLPSYLRGKLVDVQTMKNMFKEKALMVPIDEDDVVEEVKVERSVVQEMSNEELEEKRFLIEDGIAAMPVGISLKNASDASAGLVDITISALDHGIGSYRIFQPFSVSRDSNEFEVTLYHPSISVGLVPMSAADNALPGLCEDSIGFESTTGTIFVSGAEYNLNGTQSWDETGTVVKCSADFEHQTIYFTVGKLRFPVSMPGLEAMQLCPAIGLVGERASGRIIIRSQASTESDALFRNRNQHSTVDDEQVFEKPFSPDVNYIHSGNAIVRNNQTSGPCTVLMSSPVRDGKAGPRCFAFTLMNFGESGVLSFGLARKDIDRIDEPGRIPYSIGFRVDLKRARLSAAGELGLSQYSINAPFTIPEGETAFDICMHIDYDNRAIVVSIENALLTKFFLNLPESTLEDLYIAVTLRSAGQLVIVQEIRYPEPVRDQVKYILACRNEGKPISPLVLAQMSSQKEIQTLTKAKEHGIIARFFQSEAWSRIHEEEEEEEEEDADKNSG
eukprot:TRINITY_DN5163_c0_g2_i4.p1 TRINITY_DN5163_c0_g2~~TRINITY_DN5163_c0_g2_i4.p1  ORF type:complete len:1479 (-),score=317.51 TRINITY_DN5163_c0_g2_i4:238-4674(-)